ncbi:pentapeptide repeat-containing protein [Streptomyces sp. NPDC000878]
MNPARLVGWIETRYLPVTGLILAAVVLAIALWSAHRDRSNLSLTTDAERKRHAQRQAIRAALGSVSGVTMFILLFWQGPWWFDHSHLRKTNLEAADGAIITGFRTGLVALAAGIIAGLGLYYTHRSHRQTERLFDHTRDKDREQAELTREGQVTGRYVEAVKLLASDKITERLGGIYALQRIMGDSQKDYITVVEVLAAFLREPLPAKRRNDNNLPGDRQAALTVLGHRIPYTGKGHYTLNLQGAPLSYAHFTGTEWSHANLAGANLARAVIVDIYGESMNFAGANLAGADMHNSNMPGVVFSGADLTDAQLPGAMPRASLYGTDLRRVRNLHPSNLESAYADADTKLPEGMAVD